MANCPHPPMRLVGTTQCGTVGCLECSTLIDCPHPYTKLVFRNKRPVKCGLCRVTIVELAATQAVLSRVRSPRASLSRVPH
jgi:hypothetical protein